MSIVLSTLLLPDNVDDLYLSDPYTLYDLIGQVLHVDPAAYLPRETLLITSCAVTPSTTSSPVAPETIHLMVETSSTRLRSSLSMTIPSLADQGTIPIATMQILEGSLRSSTSLRPVKVIPSKLMHLQMSGSNPSVGFHLRLDGTTLVMQMTIPFDSVVEHTREVRFPDFDPNDAYGRHAIDVFDFGNGHHIDVSADSSI